LSGAADVTGTHRPPKKRSSGVTTRIRLKIELNPGGVGVRLDKLAKISTEVEKFIRFLAMDAGATPQLGDFVAKNFYDGSFGSVIEYVNNVDPGR
jgi:hypothetical protein